MDLFKLFIRHNVDTVRQEDDLLESDDFSQLLTNLTKLIAEVKDEESLSKFVSSYEEEFDLLSVNIENLKIIVPKVYEIINVFDFREVKFSGYRSFFNIIKKCVKKISSALRKTLQFQLNRKQIEGQWSDFSQCLAQLTTAAKCLYQMMLVNINSKCLFLNKIDDEVVYLKMIESYNSFSSEPFYGQCLGFYLCESCLVMAKVLCSIQLGLGQAMSVPKSNLEVFVATVINGTNSLFLENKRGSQMSNLFKQATVTFCKQFWNLVDHPVLIRWSHLVLPYLKVIKQITLEASPIYMPLIDSKDIVKIHPPVAPDGFADVQIRLLSSKFREGMEWFRASVDDKVVEPPSKSILIHCHGGGFVAQSSQSHDGYLRQWAIDLDCPIVSVDYSHAPENPFPRAHEECFFTYCWVLKNIQQFGCEPDCRVVICGDSAGGNLVLGCVVKAIKLNIRIPDGIFVAYPAALVDFIPSPARILGVIDPILPIGVLARCLLAYVGVDEENLMKSISSMPSEIPEGIELAESEPSLKKEKASFLDRDAFDSKGVRLFYSKQEAISPLQLLEMADIAKDPIMSPLLASEDIFRRFPPLSVVGSEFDPLLDDSVELCKKVDAAGGQFIHLQVMPNIPHGFLSMASPVTRECSVANKVCVEEIQKLLSGNYL